MHDQPGPRRGPRGGACGRGPSLVPPTVDEDPTLPAEEWNGSRFHVVRSGATTGTPIISLAGGPGNDFAYLTRLTTTCDGRSLGTTHPIILWDQRGCGQSRRHDDSLLTLDTFRADLDGLVDRVDPAGAGVILVGHSWGGMYATDYVDRHPGRVKALVLLEPGQLTSDLEKNNPTAISVTLTSEWVSDLAWSQDFLALDDHERIDFGLLAAARGAQPTRVNREDPPNVRLGGAVVRKNFQKGFMPREYDFTRHLSAFTTEVLFIAGNHPLADLGDVLQRKQVGFFPNARLEVLEGASHSDTAWANGCTSAELMDAYFRRVGVTP